MFVAFHIVELLSVSINESRNNIMFLQYGLITLIGAFYDIPPTTI